jgi:uncharacterized protein (TIGR02246 family)
MTPQNLKEIEAIKLNIDAYAEAWNVRNAKMLSALFTEDADFVMVMGIWLKGREEIERNHAELFSTVMRKSHLTFTDTKIKFLKSDIVIAHITWEIVNQITPYEETLPLRFGILSSIMTEEQGIWKISAAQNTDTIRPSDYKPYNK